MGSSILKKWNKGQLSMLDLIVSTMIFVVIISMFIWAWGETQGTIWSYEKAQDYRDKALDVTDVLLHTEGYPLSWEELPNLTGRMRSIGLVSEGSVLDEEKLERFSEIPYKEARKVLGLEKEGFYISITETDNDPLYSFGEKKDAISVVDRPAILDGTIVDFKLRLFEA